LNYTFSSFNQAGFDNRAVNKPSPAENKRCTIVAAIEIANKQVLQNLGVGKEHWPV